MLKYLFPTLVWLLTLGILGCSQVPEAADIEDVHYSSGDSQHFDPSDSTIIDSSVSYFRVRQKGFVVDKPFPTIYFSNKWIDVNNTFFESDVVMSQGDLVKVHKIFVSLSCTPDLSNQPRGEGIEVIAQIGGSKATCFLIPVSACQFLDDLRLADYDYYRSYNMNNLSELAGRINCRK